MENMKIEINEFQPVEEIFKELERLGYRKGTLIPNANVVVTWEFLKKYSCYCLNDRQMVDHPTYTTLEELKKMERN